MMANRFHAILFGVAVITAGSLTACGGTDNGPASSGSPAGSVAASAAPATEVNVAGDIPDTQTFVDYSGAGYTVRVPEGWARTDSPSSTLFSDKYNSIQIDTSTAEAAPTIGTGQAELTAIGSSATGFSPGDVVNATRPAGVAVLITFRADSPPNDVTGKVTNLDVERYEFFKDGHRVSLTLSGPTGSDNVDPWRTVTESFRWTS